MALGRTLTSAQAAAGALVLLRLARGRRRRAPLVRQAPDPGASISVVVPARDEERRLWPCLEGLAADSDLLEVVVVDDRSSDDTAGVARRAGARVIEGVPRPAGWAGKTWALQQGIEAARGSWVVHVDADARPRPGLARALVAAAREHGDDVLSAGVTFRCDTAAERLLHPAFLATIAYRFGPTDALGFRPWPARAMLNGQCVLLPRERFLAAGGYGRVRANMTEDSALARSLARDGWRVGFADAGALLEVHMYESARATWAGWGRSIASPDATAPAWQTLDVATLWLTLGLPPLRLLAGRATWVDGALLALRVALGAQLARRYRPRGIAQLLAPLADPAVAARFTWSVLRPTRTWRGRTYA